MLRLAARLGWTPKRLRRVFAWHHRLPLRSAYEVVQAVESPYSHYKTAFVANLDYVWCSSDGCGSGGAGITPVEVLEHADEALLRKLGGCPCASFPSDHLSLRATFRWVS
jgi:mRNA deadenylase 3'-5' endonuclease subunit Ccr4